MIESDISLLIKEYGFLEIEYDEDTSEFYMPTCDDVYRGDNLELIAAEALSIRRKKHKEDNEYLKNNPNAVLVA